MTTYAVHAARFGRVWALEAKPEGVGVHTQARRLDQAEAVAREAIAIVLDVRESEVDVEIVVDLDADIQRRMEEVRSAQAAASAAQAAAAAASRDLARKLADSGYTVRDAGRILGVSAQRVSQLLN